MIESYILVTTEAGKAGQVALEIQGLRGVDRVELVTGAYDVIATASAGNVSELATFVAEEVLPIPGVIRSLTCPAATHQRLWEERLEPAYAGR